LLLRVNPTVPLHDSITGRATSKRGRTIAASRHPAKRTNFVALPQIPFKHRKIAL
jgi:hypothetical protein